MLFILKNDVDPLRNVLSGYDAQIPGESMIKTFDSVSDEITFVYPDFRGEAKISRAMPALLDVLRKNKKTKPLLADGSLYLGQTDGQMLKVVMNAAAFKAFTGSNPQPGDFASAIDEPPSEAIDRAARR